MILVPNPLKNSVINTPHMSLVYQHSYSSSNNTTHEFQDYSIPRRPLPDTLNTMPPLSTKTVSRKIYGCMVDVSKLIPAKRQQRVVMLLHNYHELYNTNETSSMFVSPPPILNIE